MIEELKTAVPSLCRVSVGSIGPVVAVAIRYTRPATNASPTTQIAFRGTPRFSARGGSETGWTDVLALIVRQP